MARGTKRKDLPEERLCVLRIRKNRETKEIWDGLQKLNSYHHPNLVNCVDSFETLRSYYSIYQVPRGQSLARALTDHRVFRRFTEADLAKITSQVLDAVILLHSRNLTHRHINFETVFMDSDSINPLESPILLQNHFPPNYVRADKIGMQFASPEFVRALDREREVLEEKPHYSRVCPEVGKPTDIWSIGALTHFLLRGYPLFYSCSSLDIFIEKLTSGDEIITHDVPMKRFISNEGGLIIVNALDFIHGCLSKDPGTRMTAQEARDHQWFKNASGTIDLVELWKIELFNAREVFQRAVRKVILLNRFLDAVRPGEGSSSTTEFINTDSLSKNVQTLPIYRMKLVLLGQGRAGKTSLLRSLRGVEFRETEKSTVYLETIEVAQVELNISESWTEVKEFVPQFKRSIRARPRWKSQFTEYDESDDSDDEGEERTVFATPKFEAPQPSSELEVLKSVVEDHVRRTADEDIQKIITEYDVISFSNQTSDTSTIMKVYDFAGQSRYSAFQQLFVTRQAIYVVAFRLNRMFPVELFTVNSEELDVVIGWLSNIHCRSPRMKIILVGTGCDENWRRNGLREFESLIKLLPNDVLQQLIPTQTTSTHFTHITSSKTGEGVDLLQGLINDAANVSIKLEGNKPIDWILFQDEVSNIIAKDVNVLSLPFSTLLKLGTKFRVVSDLELEMLLRYWHDIGVVLYYPENVLLKDSVFINPKGIINLIACLFPQIDEDGETFCVKSNDFKAIRDLEEKRIWRMSLLHSILLKNIRKDELQTFIELLKEFDLLCVSHDEEGPIGIIPSLLDETPICEEEIVSQELGAGYEQIDIALTFPKSFLPPGIFHQLAVRFASISPSLSQLYHRQALVYVKTSRGQKNTLLIREKLKLGVIHFSVFVASNNIRVDFAEIFFSISTTIDSVICNHWSRNLEYYLGLVCPGNQSDMTHLVSPERPEFKSSSPHRLICNHHSHKSKQRYMIDLEPLKRFWFEDNTLIASPSLRNGSGSIMLSYSWGKIDDTGKYPTQELVKRVKLGLEKHGFNVWMDIVDMGPGDMIDRMTTVISNCSAVVPCVTNDYHVKDTNANREFRFACSARKPIFGVMLTPDTNMFEKNYVFQTSNAKFYDVSRCGTDEDKWSFALEELAHDIRLDLDQRRT
ncbi:hypothetical protein HK098_005360 [Nowakowskiella sp. JEL0407]|nr:hypothetical protein HK098_005360 [Nowakowskiella sp. JEL0407]